MIQPLESGFPPGGEKIFGKKIQIKYKKSVHGNQSHRQTNNQIHSGRVPLQPGDQDGSFQALKDTKIPLNDPSNPILPQNYAFCGKYFFRFLHFYRCF